MKSLVESLFDKDLVTKDISIVKFLFDILDSYKQLKEADLKSIINDVGGAFGSNKSFKVKSISDLSKVKANTFYICYMDKLHLVLMLKDRSLSYPYIIVITANGEEDWKTSYQIISPHVDVEGYTFWVNTLLFRDNTLLFKPGESIKEINFLTYPLSKDDIKLLNKIFEDDELNL